MNNNTRRKISKAMKGKKPKHIVAGWNKGKKMGHLPEETRKKMSKAHEGRKPYIMTNAIRQKMSKSKLGIVSPNKGKIFSKEWRRKLSEAHKGIQSGDKNPQWKGGKSFEPYGFEFNEDLREVIRNRDRRKCCVCEKTELENKEKLTVHHIDYCKRNNNPNNLITLCRRCHSKTTCNRDYWKDYFKAKKYD